MYTAERLAEIRAALDLSQEEMARLLGVSFATVNRWENRSSGPTGAVLEIYRALHTALAQGNVAARILGDASLGDGRQLQHIFNAAYGGHDGLGE